MVYANNSAIQITEIGETNTAMPPPPNSNNGLQCITDRMPCCAAQSNRFGEWYFPDEVTVPPIVGAPTTFYRNRGDDGTVNLNRLNTNIIRPTGLFCCEVSDASGRTQRVCANIGELISHEFQGLCLNFYLSFPMSSFWSHCTNQRQCSYSSSRTELYPHL